jgi:acetyl-CoA synthetase
VVDVGGYEPFAVYCSNLRYYLLSWGITMSFRIKSFQQYQQDYQMSIDNNDGFWADKADHFVWHSKWQTVRTGDFNNLPVRWFEGAKLNITENCLDRHLHGLANKPAIIWEPNDPSEDSRTLSYEQLHQQVSQFANVLRKNNVRKGDRVCIYMPMVPEVLVAMLACARIGAIHSVVFAGFSAEALADRLEDMSAKILITSDGGFRGDQIIPLKAIADEALQISPQVSRVIVYQRTGLPINMQAGRDVWWHEEWAHAKNTCPAEVMEAEDELFILYTSGSTGKPKGIVHTTAGYMVAAQYSYENVFDIHEDDIFWCTADVGWITGHTYLAYGPLLAGSTIVLFEGIPTYPAADRYWKVIDKHAITHFYTAPTVIRTLMTFGLSAVRKQTLGSLRVLGSVGEPIDEKAWHWFDDNIGKNRCPIVDTWWQTETGSIAIAPLANITPTKPTFASLPLPGIQPCFGDNTSDLCLAAPWPSMARRVWGDDRRYQETYFSTHSGLYFSGDSCRVDSNGYYKVLGRVDDVINVSGHRFGTAELEDAISSHSLVTESAVVGAKHAIKGQCIYVYAVVSDPTISVDTLQTDIDRILRRKIGSFAHTDQLVIVKQLPKTRSGKIVRRILRKIADGEASNLGDTSTLVDQKVITELTL